MWPLARHVQAPIFLLSHRLDVSRHFLANFLVIKVLCTHANHQYVHQKTASVLFNLPLHQWLSHISTTIYKLYWNRNEKTWSYLATLDLLSENLLLRWASNSNGISIISKHMVLSDNIVKQILPSYRCDRQSEVPLMQQFYYHIHLFCCLRQFFCFYMPVFRSSSVIHIYPNLFYKYSFLPISICFLVFVLSRILFVFSPHISLLSVHFLVFLFFDTFAFLLWISLPHSSMMLMWARCKWRARLKHSTTELSCHNIVKVGWVCPPFPSPGVDRIVGRYEWSTCTPATVQILKGFDSIFWTLTQSYATYLYIYIFYIVLSLYCWVDLAPAL